MRVLAGRNNREVVPVHKIAGRLVPFDGFFSELKLRSLLTYLFLLYKYGLSDEDHIGTHFEKLKLLYHLFDRSSNA